jgi:hypothetical protein
MERNIVFGMWIRGEGMPPVEKEGYRAHVVKSELYKEAFS